MIDEKKLIERLMELRKKKHRLFLREDRDEIRYFYEINLLKELIEVVQQMPKAGEWIPVSERLPETEGSYLVTTKTFIDFRVMYGYFSDSLQNFICKGKAVAWMPLPEPYKGE